MWVLDILHFLFWIGWVISFLSNKIRKCFCLRKSPFSIMAISLFFFFFVSLVYVMVGFKKDHMKILVNSQGLVRFSRECQNPKMKKARLIKKEMWMNQEMLRRVSMRRKAVFQGWKWIKRWLSGFIVVVLVVALEAYTTYKDFFFPRYDWRSVSIGYQIQIITWYQHRRWKKWKIKSVTFNKL